MKKMILILVSCIAMTYISAQIKKDSTINFIKPTIVDAACGQCQFGLETQRGCDLAIRIDSVAYFVDGSKIDD
jgi:hypothetical protein